MKVGINGLALFPGKIGGAEQYLRNMVHQFRKTADLELFLFLNESAIKSFEEDERLHLIGVDLYCDRETMLMWYIDFFGLEIWFNPLMDFEPLKAGIPVVSTLFDIQHEYYPEYFDKKTLSERRRLYRLMTEGSDRLMTISQYSAMTLTEKGGAEPGKITVTYLDADDSFRCPEDETLAREIRGKLPERYILFPAAMWPHKNHITLLKALLTVREEYGIDLQLVMTGGVEKETGAIRSFIEQNGLRDAVVYLGYLPQKEMPYVYRSAEMLVFPSLFEGFALPLVEAMRSGLPIVAANATCLPEVADGAALLVDPLNPREIAEAILRLHTDGDLRRELVEKGRKRADCFSWEKTAGQTIEEFRRLVLRERPLKKTAPAPRISVLIPEGDSPEELCRSVDSVLAQNYANVGCVVAGNAHAQTLARYGRHVEYAESVNGGLWEALKAAFRLADGALIGILLPGDTYLPDSLQKIALIFQNGTGLCMAWGETALTDPEGNTVDRFRVCVPDGVRPCGLPSLPALFFTGEAFAAAAGLWTGRCADTMKAWKRLFGVKNCLYLPDTVVRARCEAGQSMCASAHREAARVEKKLFGSVSVSRLKALAKQEAVEKGGHRRLWFAVEMLRYNASNPAFLWKKGKSWLMKRVSSIRG